MEINIPASVILSQILARLKPRGNHVLVVRNSVDVLEPLSLHARQLQTPHVALLTGSALGLAIMDALKDKIEASRLLRIFGKGACTKSAR